MGWRNPQLSLRMGMADHDPVNVRTLDSSGNAFHPVYVAGATAPTKLTDRHGYSFDTGDYFDASLHTGLFLANNFSIIVLLYLTGSGDRSIVATGATGGLFRVVTGTNVLRFTKQGIGSASSTNIVPSGMFTSVAVTVSSTAGVHLYINGRPDGSLANNADITSTAYYIGAQTIGPVVNGFSGYINQFEQYKTVLTATQVMDNHIRALQYVNAL